MLLAALAPAYLPESVAALEAFSLVTTLVLIVFFLHVFESIHCPKGNESIYELLRFLIKLSKGKKFLDLFELSYLGILGLQISIFLLFKNDA